MRHRLPFMTVSLETMPSTSDIAMYTATSIPIPKATPASPPRLSHAGSRRPASSRLISSSEPVFWRMVGPQKWHSLRYKVLMRPFLHKSATAHHQRSGVIRRGYGTTSGPRCVLRASSSRLHLHSYVFIKGWPSHISYQHSEKHYQYTQTVIDQLKE